MPLRSYRLPLAWVITVFVAIYSGYALHGIVHGLQRHAAPVVRTDVSSDELVRLGFAFGSPLDTIRFTVGIVGNGVGDSSVYASFDWSSPSSLLSRTRERSNVRDSVAESSRRVTNPDACAGVSG
ncbi:MAG: hypothetical protein ABI411_15835 [Tahibacter sp.]